MPPRRNSNPRKDSSRREPEEFEQKLIEIRRVTRVQKGGKRMRFRALVVLGDHKGRVGYGLGKGADVTKAIAKAAITAKKNIINVTIVNETIPHPVRLHFKAASLYLKPAPKGTGIIAGGAIRSVLLVSGVGNAVAKMLGSGNKVNNVKLTIMALQSLKQGPRKTESVREMLSNSNVKSHLIDSAQDNKSGLSW